MRQQLFFQNHPLNQGKNSPDSLALHRGDSSSLTLYMTRNGVDRAVGRVVTLMLAGLCLFILSPDVSYLHPGYAKGIHPLDSIRAHLFFQCHVNETLSPSMPRGKK